MEYSALFHHLCYFPLYQCGLLLQEFHDLVATLHGRRVGIHMTDEPADYNMNAEIFHFLYFTHSDAVDDNTEENFVVLKLFESLCFCFHV